MASFNTTVIARVAAALYDVQLGNAGMTWANDQVNSVTYGGNVNALVQALVTRDFAGMTNAQIAAVIVKNVGITTGAADAEAFVAGQLTAAGAANAGATIVSLVNQFAALKTHPVAAYNVAAARFNTQIAAADAYAQMLGTVDVPVNTPASIVAKSFNLVAGTALGADVMRITGGMDARIDFTNPANQIRGLDLDGDGLIEANGIENVSSNFAANQRAANFEIVDAYPRNPLNHTDSANNYLGDIAFDGTGFAGDGVSTNGNVFLGGLGLDTAFGGVGNDFLAGGGIAQGRSGADVLSGGRNADFFFAEFSGLDATDGSTLVIDGGNTADDNSAGIGQSAQDNDWLLFEASDDDEPVQIWLNDDNVGPVEPGDGINDGKGRVLSRFGESMTIDDVENIDASGNLYGLLNGVNVEIGGRAVDARDVAGTSNYGLGSSAQLNIIGSNAGNIIIAGYDNDSVDGGEGNDLLMGGNLQQLLETVTGGVTNPNLAGIANDGRDELLGGGGDDNIVFEADGGLISGGGNTAASTSATRTNGDTLWLTKYSLGTRTPAQLLADGRLRFDLTSENGILETSTNEGGAGYGGANVGTTADQTNYVSTLITSPRVAVTQMENIDATGLGAIDFKAAGANTPELTFTNQQNFKGYNGNLQLLGSQDSNNLYAGAGNDEIHGRGGRDDMQGGGGDDDFYFAIGGEFEVGGPYTMAPNDSVDVIRRKVDANGDDLWDTTAAGAVIWGQDFGLGGTVVANSSILTIVVTNSDEQLDVRRVSFFVNGTEFVSQNLGSSLAADLPGLVAKLQSDLTAQSGTGGVVFAVATTAPVGALAGTMTVTVTPPAGSTASPNFFRATDTAFNANSVQVVGGTTNSSLGSTSTDVVGGLNLSGDRLIYKAWEDRNDNEGVDDDTVLGSTMSLGTDAYAEDLVISFQADGTRLAEDQSYTTTFANLTTQDRVTVNVNGVLYTLQVGVNLDGNIVANEDGVGDTQVGIQNAFLLRLADFITNSFTDDDTVAGKVDAAAGPLVAGVRTTIVLTQRDYHAEDTVFMRTPVVTIENLSGGQAATATTVNNSQHEVLLFNFDGRDNKLNETNVLFWGQEAAQRANLETSKTLGGALAGTDALVIDGRTNDLFENIANDTKAAIADNQATNAPLEFLNFTVHGDDFLLGGLGVDQITGGTGDDRVIGSKGSDAAPAIGATTGELADGGKNVYAVQVLGEPKARVYVLNKWEARNPTLVSDLSGLTISSITPIRDNESGTALSGGTVVTQTMFDDTLQFEQETFGADARFTITLDDFTLAAGNVVQTKKDGAGLVWIDVNGNGIQDAGVDTFSRFTNFENIRTVSGSGRAVAGDKQGNDTLDVTKLSSVTEGAGGVSYNLTGDADAGEVRYSKDAIVTASVLPNIAGAATEDRPQAADYEELVVVVDGVENVLASTGNDLLRIDETEAAKNNLFSAGLGIDRIIYEDDYDGGTTVGAGQPTVTIRVNNLADTDTVTMRGGRVGTLNTASGGAVDTLISVEYLSLAGETAQSVREDDVLDVSAMATGAVVDYTNGEVRTTVFPFIGDRPGVGVQLVIENIVQMERVIADGNDMVIVADADVMNNNARSDEGVDATPAKNILFMTYRDFDDLNTAATTRKSFAAQVADGTIQQVINQGQFSFSLSEVGTDVDVDRVDYHNELGRIVVPVGQGSWTVPGAATNKPQYVVVDGDMDGVFSDAESRVDALWGVEEIVAAAGESVMDFTAVGAARQITFKYVAPSPNPAENQVVEQTIRIADGTGNTLAGLNAFVERYVYNKTTPAVADATWNRVEGSDAAEVVIYEGSEDLVNQSGLDHRFTNDILTLRGGNNEVRYSPLETSVRAVITVTEENLATTTVSEGLITAIVTFQDGLGVLAPSGTFLGGMHTITSNTSDNTTAAGNLKLEGSQDAEDLVEFAGLGSKTFILGASPGVITVSIGTSTTMVLTGFEFVQDAGTNDIYNFASLVGSTGITFLDTLGDHDVIKVGNDAAANTFNGGAGTAQIDLQDLKVFFNFDFDVLDISGVNLATLTTVNGSTAVPGDFGDDELVTGVFGTVATTAVNDFEAVVVSNATIAAHGATFVLNTTADTLVIGTGAGAKTLQFNASMNNLSFGGTMLGDTGVPRATTPVTVTATGPDNVTIWGGDGADSITTAGGNDIIRGGGGNDVINAGFTASAGAVLTQTLAGVGTTGGTEGGGGVVFNLLAVTTNLFADATPELADAFDYANGADADQIGAIWAAVPLASWVTGFTGSGLTAAEAGTLQSVTYNATSNDLVFTFANSAAGSTITVADLLAASLLGSNGDAVLTGAEAATGFVAAIESSDTYVFEATAALNGVDTISNFNVTNAVTDDRLDFRAFLGPVVTSDADADEDFAGESMFFTGAENVGLFYNAPGGVINASMVSTSVVGTGKIQMLDNGKAVVLVTADADGGADATVNAYNVYYVQDTNAAVGASTFTVTLVGTLISQVEINAFDFINSGVIDNFVG